MVIKVQESYQELPGVRRGRVTNPLDGPNAASIVGRQTQEIGRAVQSAGGVAADIVRQEQEKANKARLNDVYNQMSAAAHALRYDQKDGYLTLKGGNAVMGVTDGTGITQPLTEYYGHKLDKELSNLRAQLGNSALIGQFDLLADDMRTKFRGEAVSYEAEQASVYAVQVQDATIMTSANELAAAPFGPASALHVSRARDAAVGKGQAAGLSGDALNIAVQASLGKMHSAVIDSLLDGKNVAGAKKYFEQYRDQFGELDAKNVGAKLETAWGAAEAIIAVDEVVSQFPLQLNQTAPQADMDAALRDRFKDNPEGLKAARSELAQRLSAHEFQETETNASNTNTVWSMLNRGQSLASVESSNAWLALPGKDQNAIREAVKRQREGGDLTPVALGSWAELMGNTEFLMKASPTVLAAMEPQFGSALTKQLIAQAQSVKANAAGTVAKAQLDQPSIPEPLYKRTAALFGIGVNKDFKDWSENDRAQYATFMSDMWTAVAQEQAATGKIIPPAELEQFLLRAGNMHPRWGNAGATVNNFTTTGKLEQVPLSALTDPNSPVGRVVANYLYRNGLPPTPENLRKGYVDYIESGVYLVKD